MKVYKQNNKLIIYLPSEISRKLSLGENDELDYFEFNDKSFLIAKKADIVGMLTGTLEKKVDIVGMLAGAPEKKTAKPPQGNQPQEYRRDEAAEQLSREEIAVLKKLDTLRYPQRTVENVGKILDKSENAVLQSLLKRNAVSLFTKDGRTVYSIPRDIYNNFLMRKKSASDAKTVARDSPVQTRQQPEPFRKLRTDMPIRNPNNAPEISELESNGYIVLQTEAEAARVSLMLEDSIRHGQVLGTRSFGNRKFFIVTRQFLDRHIPSIFKELRSGPKRTPDIAGTTKIDEDAARAILYILAENGDITERRKDYFAMA